MQKFTVYDADGNSHGDYDTLEEAHGCIAFDGLKCWQIVQGDWGCIDQSNSWFQSGPPVAMGRAITAEIQEA